MSYKELITEMYELVNQGKSFEALDKYYHENVVVHDNTSPLRKGREAQKEAVQQWFDMVQEFHESGVSSITSDEENGITMVESWTEITMKGAPEKMRMEEVGVQKWEGDRIIHERFYYQFDGPTE